MAATEFFFLKLTHNYFRAYFLNLTLKVLNLGTKLPGLVRRRTIKLMQFFDKKKPINFEQFLEVCVIF